MVRYSSFCLESKLINLCVLVRVVLWVTSFAFLHFDTSMAGTNYSGSLSDLDIQRTIRVSSRWEHKDCQLLPWYAHLAYTEMNIRRTGKQRLPSLEKQSHLLTKKEKQCFPIGHLGIQECSSNVKNNSLKPTSDSENG